ncbi:MAG: WbqC family protein [Ruminococcus flavefaciens]|nr:WbqC family protein [Ruminococcus flavefaciens]
MEIVSGYKFTYKDNKDKKGGAAVMVMGGNQPYFMPYIEYWQLINAVDVFIISDNYNFIEGGWISRNRILENGKPRFYNIEIQHLSSERKINELYISDKFDKEKKLFQLRCVYKKAPYFQDGYDLMQQIFDYDERNLAYFLENSIKTVCGYLDITTKFVRASSIPGNCDLKKEYKIFDQCRYVGADTYINAIGGQSLYSYGQFKEQGIKLGFIKSHDISYKQLWYEFVPNLSIIDVIMFNSKEEIQKMLEQYTVLWEGM